MRIDEVAYLIAEPAPKWKILLWFISFGNAGEVFVEKKVNHNKYYDDSPSLNCRSVMMPCVPEAKRDFEPDFDVEAPALYYPPKDA